MKLKTTEELIALARKEPAKQQRHLALMPVIDVLRNEKEFTWEEISRWISMNDGGTHTPSYWAQRYTVWRTQQKKVKLPVAKARTNPHPDNELEVGGNEFGIGGSGHYMIGRGRLDDLLRAAVKLGVISKAELTEHFKAADEADNLAHQRELKNRFKREAAFVGIELTEKQLAKLK